jgi:hypothetical protein
MRFETIWRNKWLTANARNIGEMAAALQAAAANSERCRRRVLSLTRGVTSQATMPCW